MPQKILYQSPQHDNYQVLGKDVVFKLENYGLIKMIHLIFEVIPQIIIEGINVITPSLTVPIPSSPYLIENVELQSYGNTIANLSTSYILGRYDEMDSDLYKQVLDGSNLPSPLTKAATVSLPLFFWTIDNQMLDTFKYPNLTIRATTKSKLSEMGFTLGTLNAINIKLKVVYDQQPMLMYKPVALKNPYNIYRSVMPVPYLATSTTVKLNVPFKVCNLYFMMRAQLYGNIKKQIDSIKLTSPTGEIGTYDGLTNYFLGEKNSANFSNTFAIQLHSRYDNSGEYLVINGQQNPLIAELSFSALAADFYLYICYEYYSNIVEGDNGMLIEDNTRSFVRS